MRFHVLALPHTIVDKSYNACAYTMKVYNFCKMMTEAGHEVDLYAHPDSTAPCTRLHPFTTKEEHLRWFGGNNWKKDFFELDWNPDKIYWQLTCKRTAALINSIGTEKDFVCIIGGWSQKLLFDLCDKSRFQFVEFGIGYRGIIPETHHVFESYAQMHKIYGMQDYNSNGIWYDRVIPNYFDPDDFEFAEFKKDYYLFIGRMVLRKGPQIAADVTREIGAKLIMAGQGVLSNKHGVIKAAEVTVSGHHIQHVGYANVEQRKRLMKYAKAVFVPTWYLEPFGGVAVEAMMCGTPVITSDWGAFPETVVNGITGYRCRTMAEFVQAAKDVTKLNPSIIRKYALANYSLEPISKAYIHYFESLHQLWDKKGWGIVRDVDLSNLLK